MSITRQFKSGRCWSIAAADLPRGRQEGFLEETFPEDLGSGGSRIYQLDAGLSYIETRCTPCIDLAVLSRLEDQPPRLVVTLGLQGKSRFAGKHGDAVVFEAGYTTITTFAASAGERRYAAGQAVTQLRLAVDRNWLEQYFGAEAGKKLLNHAGVRTIAFRPIAPQTAIAAQQLVSHKTPPTLRPLFMHGQALAILAAELPPLCETEDRDAAHCNRRDHVMAQAARDILHREFKNPPSIDELAKRVGTNPCKLKRLFHHFFDATPYGMLLEIRMQTAYRLLQATHCQVSAAAEFVGYSHASNFSAAFTKYFGVPPKRV